MLVRPSITVLVDTKSCFYFFFFFFFFLFLPGEDSGLYLSIQAYPWAKVSMCLLAMYVASIAFMTAQIFFDDEAKGVNV